MNNGYFIIDAHCHIYPAKIAARAAAGIGTFYRTNSACGGTAEELLRRADACGIDRFIVESVATSAHQVRDINEFIAAEVAAAGGRFFGLGTLYPDSPDLVGDYHHLRELGLHGVKLHPDIQGFKIDDFRCLKIYEMCEADGLPILMHTGDSRYDYSNPNRLVPILRIYTGLKLIAAHMGGYTMWEEASRKLCDVENLTVDCSSTLPYLPHETAVEIIRRYGAARVLFGTDYPLWTPEGELASFFSLGLTPAENKAILADNARRVFGITE